MFWNCLTILTLLHITFKMSSVLSKKYQLNYQNRYTKRIVNMNIKELQEFLKNVNLVLTDSQIARIWEMDPATFSRKKKQGSEIKQKNIIQLEKELNIQIAPNRIINKKDELIILKLKEIADILGYSAEFKKIEK